MVGTVVVPLCGAQTKLKKGDYDMTKIEILAQIFGIIGMVIIISSFQFKDNKRFFIFQGLGSTFFFLNFITDLMKIGYEK